MTLEDLKTQIEELDLSPEGEARAFSIVESAIARGSMEASEKAELSAIFEAEASDKEEAAEISSETADIIESLVDTIIESGDQE